MPFKTVYVFGDPGTGKTSMISMLLTGELPKDIRPTKKISTKRGTIRVEKENNSITIKETNATEIRDENNRLIDDYGKEYQFQHQENIPEYIYLVYDITRRETFDSIQQFWIPYINQLQFQPTSITVVGNKKDLEEHRVVSEEEGREYASRNNFQFMEYSSFLDDSETKLLKTVASSFRRGEKYTMAMNCTLL